MANNLHIPDELLAELQAKAASIGTTADDMAADAVRKMIEKRKWAEIQERSEARWKAKGEPPPDPVHAVREVRDAQRGR